MSYILHIVLANKLIASCLSIYLSFFYEIDFLKNELLFPLVLFGISPTVTSYLQKHSLWKLSRSSSLQMMLHWVLLYAFKYLVHPPAGCTRFCRFRTKIQFFHRAADLTITYSFDGYNDALHHVLEPLGPVDGPEGPQYPQYSEDLHHRDGTRAKQGNAGRYKATCWCLLIDWEKQGLMGDNQINTAYLNKGLSGLGG